MTQHNLSFPQSSVCLEHLYGVLQHVLLIEPPQRPLYKLHLPLTSGFFFSLPPKILFKLNYF